MNVSVCISLGSLIVAATALWITIRKDRKKAVSDKKH